MPAPSTVENVNIGVGATDKASPALAGIAGGLINVKTAALGAGAAIAAFVAKGMKDLMEFQRAAYDAFVMFDNMARGAREEMMYTAQEIGTTTPLAAKDVMESFYHMGSAALTASESIEIADEVSTFALATNLEMSEATEIAAVAMNAFGRSAENMEDTLDVMAGTEKNAMTTQKQLKDAFTYTAPVAAAFGQTLETTNAAIGMMANAGIRGSKAGTAMRRILTNLAAPTGKAGKAIKEMNLQIYETGTAGAELHQQLVNTESQIVGLTADVEQYKMQLMGLKDTERGLSLATNKAQLEIMRIKHQADSEGRRLTRNEEKRIEQLKQKQQGLRIEQMGNRIEQQKVNDSMKDAQYQKKKLQNKSDDLQTSIENEGGSMRNLVTILQDIDTITAGMSEGRRNRILEALGGKRGVSGLIAMMQNINKEGEGIAGFVERLESAKVKDVTEAMAEEKKGTLAWQWEVFASEAEMVGKNIGKGFMTLIGNKAGFSEEQLRQAGAETVEKFFAAEGDTLLERRLKPLQLLSPVTAAPALWDIFGKPIKGAGGGTRARQQTTNINVRSTHDVTIRDESDINDLADMLAELQTKGVTKEIVTDWSLGR